MNKKIIFGVLAFLLIGLAFVFAQEQKNFEYRVILNCRMEGHSEEACDIVVGNMFEISLKEGEDELRSYIVFPEDFEDQLGMRSYPREYVNCEDSSQITVAKLINENWVAVTDRIPKVEQLEGSGLQVEVLIEEPGIYAVVEETSDIHQQMSDAGIDSGMDYCKPLSCGNYKAYSTDPYNGQAKEGQSISFNFCGMVDGCQAGVDDSCSNECFEGSDPNCPSICTIEGGDCCNNALDNVCDPDCWINKTTLFGDTIVYDAIDPDCLKDSYVEKYVWLDEYEELENSDEFDPIEFQGMVSQGRVDNSRTKWTYFEVFNDPNNPKLLEGPIRFTITNGETEGAWFRDFTYTDLQDNEHKLFPLNPMPLERDRIDKSGFSVENIFVENAGIQSMQEIMIAYPYLWFLTKKDSEFDNDKGKAQFELPPTGVKKIGFWAASDEDTVRTEFAVSISARKGNADNDNDGYDNYVDCNDANPNIYPGAQELCNGLDDNCNSFNVYDVMYGKTPIEIEAETNNDPFRNSENWERENRITDHYLMPCDGFIQFNEIKSPTFLEVWKKEECSVSSSEEMFESCDAAGANGIWNSYYATIAYGGSGGGMEQKESGRFCHGWGHQGLACGGCGEEDACKCVIGSHSSCQIGALPTLDMCQDESNALGAYRKKPWPNIDFQDTEAKFNFRVSENNIISEWNDAAGNPSFPEYNLLDEINSPGNRVELKEGEMVWGYNWRGCAYCEAGIDAYCNSGSVSFEIYCYEKKVIDETNPDYYTLYVDENVANCEQKEIEDTKVHVCSTEWFDFDKKECIDETLCSFSTKTYEGGCEYLTQDAELEKEFYTYVCKADQDCYLFYKDTFDVCTETEVCDSRGNKDQDCDGLLPYEPYENKEGGDPSKPVDPDCIGVSQTGTCNIEDKTWFDGEQWTAEDYCLKCGTEDSTCQKLCEDDEASCDGGCWQDACDISANKWCKEGAWTEQNYCSKCGTLDYDCFSSVGSTCEPGACEIVEDKSCFMDSWVTTDSFGAYCESQRCNAKDSDCEVSCEENTCDIHNNKYCSNGAWTEQDYCLKCGAQDYDCGSIACTEGTCDYVAKKVCQGGAWILPTKDNYCWTSGCAETDPDYCTGCIFTEGQEEQETSCADGLDNDCDGYTDCRDSDCPSDLPECSLPPCTPGTEQSCGSNAGWCEFGTQTCQDDGKWGDCTGAVTPEIETCNNEDDDCDESIDEGCVCADGETRLCGQTMGSCSMGIQECNDGQWGLCFGSSFSTPEAEVCDGIDNDCDNEIDEGCGCVVGETQECGTDVGICEIGTQTCQDDGHWGPCENGVVSVPELCSDSLDNDCDGYTDDDDDACGVTEDRMPTCFDMIQNQGEEDVDCGGENCPDCDQSSCNDRLMNGDEEGIDCGGKCPPCSESKRLRTAAGDESDYQDDTEIFVECGDGFCDAGEEDSCPEDCDEGSSFISFLLPVIIILGLVGGLFFAYKKGLIKIKGKNNAAAKPDNKFKFSKKPGQGIRKPMFRQNAPIKRKTLKSKEELALEKSLKEQKDLLNKK